MNLYSLLQDAAQIPLWLLLIFRLFFGISKTKFYTLLEVYIYTEFPSFFWLS